MGHAIRGVIGTWETLANLIERLGVPDPTELAMGLLIVPLDDDRIDSLAVSSLPAFDGFTYLNHKLVNALTVLVNQGRALYIETDYFGGVGCQAAALLQDGAMAWQESDSTGGAKPINRGLASLGVYRSAELDEFDLIGLGRFRSLDKLGL